MEKFEVKRVISGNLWIPIVSVAALVLTTIGFIGWCVSGAGSAGFWFGAFVAVALFMIINGCIAGIEYFLFDVLTEIEVDGDTLTIRRFGKDTVLNVNDIEGYRIDDIFTGSLESRDFRRIIIMYDGAAQKISEMSHIGMSSLQKYLEERVPLIDSHHEIGRTKASFMERFYYEKLTVSSVIFDIAAILLFAWDFIYTGCTGPVSIWVTFLYPLLLAIRLGVAGGPFVMIENAKKYTFFTLITLGCALAFYYAQLELYSGPIHATNTHGFLAAQIGFVLLLYLIGKAGRILIFHRDQEKKIWNFPGNLIYGFIVFMLVWCSVHSAGMIFTVSEPYDMDVYGYRMEVKHRSGKGGGTSYYIVVEDKDEDTEFFNMPYHLFSEMAGFGNCKVRVYESSLGFKVNRLFPANEARKFDSMDFEDYLKYDDFYKVGDGELSEEDGDGKAE